MKSSQGVLAVVAVIAVVLGASTRARGDQPRTFELGKASVALRLSNAFWSNKERTDDHRRGSWSGEIQKKRIYVVLQVTDLSAFKYTSPQDVFEWLGPKDKRVVKKLYGPFDTGGHGLLCKYTLPNDGSAAVWRFIGLAHTHAYFLTIKFEGTSEGTPELAAQLCRDAVVVTTPHHDSDWSDGEIYARWRSHFPDAKLRKSRKRTVRTKNYVIIGTSTKARRIAKTLEATHKKCAAVFPRSNHTGRQLMPVFCFAKRPEFEALFRAQQSHASDDIIDAAQTMVYLDYCAFPDNAKKHHVIQAAIRQYVRSRLGLSHGRPWFVAGLGGLVEMGEKAVVSHAKSRIQSKQHIPLAELFKLKELDPSDEALALEQRRQAASVIHFARATLKDKFGEFLSRMGRIKTTKGGHQTVVVRKFFGTDMKGLEVKWASFLSD